MRLGEYDVRIAEDSYAAGRDSSAKLDSLPKAERALVTELLARFDVLTPREAQILKRLAWSRRTIAQRLNISARTVDRHISNIYAKLNLTQADQPDLRQDVVLAKAYMIHELHKEFQR